MDQFFAGYPSFGGGGGGVTTLNGMSGALTLVAGSGITITPGSGTLTIASTGGSGANTTLSNLTSPTAINQHLLAGTDATFNIGAAGGVSRFLGIYASGSVSAGRFPFTGGQSGIALVDSSFPSVNFYQGGASAYTLTADSGLKIKNIGAGNTLFESMDSAFAFRDASNALYFSGDNTVITSVVPLDMSSNFIHNVTDPVDPQDAATKAYVDASGGTPTGDPNTVAYFKADGSLADNLSFTLNETTNSLSLSLVTTGGTVSSSGNSSIAFGVAADSSQVNSIASGSLAFGLSGDNGQINANADGSFSHGYSNQVGTGTSALINATGAGAEASGISIGGTIQATTDAAYARGFVKRAATLTASGQGSMASGYSDGAVFTSSGHGSHALGWSHNGTLTASGDGSLASGLVDANASLIASGPGSLASGYAFNAFAMSATGRASIVLGTTDNGDSLSSGIASFSMGDQQTVSADLATSFGLGNNNSSYASFIIGRYGLSTGTPGGWVSTDPLFVLGNGTGVGSEHTAFQVDKDGSLYISDPSLAGASVGDVWTLQNTTTGLGAWAPGSGGGGANVNLSNLVSTAVNADIIPNTNGIRTLGSPGFEWSNVQSNSLTSASTLSIVGANGITMSSLYLNLPSGAADPTAPAGSIYYNTGSNTIRWYNGTLWADLL